MSSISDELRKWCDGVGTVKDLRALADRIDAEMVELPRDKDGVLIHVGDTVYLEDGRKAKVARITLMPTQTKYCLICRVGEKSVWYLPSGISHKPADSWERIADELVEWCNSVDVDGDACDTPRDLAERIRKLAKEDE